MNRRSLTVIMLMFLFCAAASDCFNKAERPDRRGEAYAGAASCKACHAGISTSFFHSAHRNASSEGLMSNIKATVDDCSLLRYADGEIVMVEKHVDQLYQVARRAGIRKAIDIVIGSGRKAQTFLYFDSNRVYQLPLSYFISENSWANSPNFPADHPKYDRNIPSTCFGCHASAAPSTTVALERRIVDEFERDKMIYGIDCERCHGAAAQHVTFHQSHPDEKKPMHIQSMRQLSRKQQVDACAICHSGLQDMQQSAFDFKPGDAVANYFYPSFRPADPNKLDVHGNQTQLMMASACYRKSGLLTCTSCRNPHQQERTDLASFSGRCQGCHQQPKHSEQTLKTAGQNLVSNCIDCHMPRLASSTITMLTRKSVVADSIRTHWIRVPKDNLLH